MTSFPSFARSWAFWKAAAGSSENDSDLHFESGDAAAAFSLSDWFPA